MDYRGLWRTIREIARENRKASLLILVDMMWCVIRYGAGYIDYRIFDFARLSGAQRKTFVTQGKNENLIRRLNRKSDCRLMNDKIEFNKLFESYIGREWIDLRACSKEEFASFLKGKSAIIAKPVAEVSGKGVIIVETAQCQNPKELYCRLKKSGQVLVEQMVVQHPDISRVYQDSVNTLRLFTIAMPDEVHVICRVMRFGVGGSVVDNFTAGGMFALVNEAGIIHTDAVNIKTEIFSAHPDTGEIFKGMEIPFFAEAEAMAKEAARLVPGIRYVGWDIAITHTGPLFIEANHNPGYVLMQSKVYLLENDYGLLPMIKKILKG